MRRWEQAAPTEEQQLVAVEWFKQHRDHVLRLVEGVRYAYPPTDKEDCRCPWLWKPAYWLWLLRVAKPYLEAFTFIEMQEVTDV